MDGAELIFHPIIVCYTDELPEENDMVSGLHGNRSSHDFHRCLVLSSSMNQFNSAKHRSLPETLRALLHHDNLIHQAEDLRKIGDVDPTTNLRCNGENILKTLCVSRRLPALSKLREESEKKVSRNASRSFHSKGVRIHKQTVSSQRGRGARRKKQSTGPQDPDDDYKNGVTDDLSRTTRREISTRNR